MVTRTDCKSALLTQSPRPTTGDEKCMTLRTRDPIRQLWDILRGDAGAQKITDALLELLQWPEMEPTGTYFLVTVSLKQI